MLRSQGFSRDELGCRRNRREVDIAASWVEALIEGVGCGSRIFSFATAGGLITTNGSVQMGVVMFASRANGTFSGCDLLCFGPRQQWWVGHWCTSNWTPSTIPLWPQLWTWYSSSYWPDHWRMVCFISFWQFFDILMVDMAFQVDWVCRSAKKLWWIFFPLPAVCLFWLLLCEVLRSWILRDAIMCNSFAKCWQVGSFHRCPLW